MQTSDTYIGSTAKGYVPEIRNSDHLQTKPSIYSEFLCDVTIAMTQSLGHGGMTKFQPEKHTEFFIDSDDIRVILGSDGFFDMIILEDSVPRVPELTQEDIADIEREKHDLMTMSADELLMKAELRWKKPDWIYHWSHRDFSMSSVTNFNGCYDDISVIVFDKK